MALTGFELWLANQIGGAAAKEVVSRLRTPSFKRALVKRVTRHPLQRKLTLRERWRLRKLVDDPEALKLLLSLDESASELLAQRVQLQVLAITRIVESVDDFAVEVANVLLVETPGALEMPDAFAAVSYQVRSANQSVSAVHEDVREVGRDVRRIRESIADEGREVDPYVLLRGPMKALSLTADYDQAQALKDSDPSTAARISGVIAEKLEAAGYGGLARPVWVERAQLLTRAKDVDAAAASWMPLIFQELSAGIGSVAGQAVTSLRTLAAFESSPLWLSERADAVEWAFEWFRNPGISAQDLLGAACAAVDAGDPECGPLLVLAAEAALASGEDVALTSVVDTLTSTAAVADEETAVRLNLVVADVVGDDGLWQGMLAQAEPGSAAIAPRLAALVFARRGRQLFWRGEAKEAELAYRSAVERACTAQLWQDAADWLLSAWRVASRTSSIDQDDLFDLPRLAATLRATGPGALLKRGYDPYTAALEDMLAAKLNSALPHLRRYLLDSVRVAHLEDELNAHGRLGELYERTGVESAAAIMHLAQAGDAENAARVAASTPFFVDCSGQAKSPQLQTQAAALQVTAAQADLVPNANVEEWSTIALDAAVARKGGIFGPQSWVQGFRVLAGLAQRIPEHHIGVLLEAIDKLIPRGMNNYTWADDAIVDILAGLALGRPAHRSAVAARMVAVFDASDDMARQLLNRGASITFCFGELREPLCQRAAQGHRRAAQLLAIQGDKDPVVVTAADAVVAAEISRPPAYTTVSMQILGDVALAAYQARCLPIDRQADLAQSFAERCLDAADAEANRTQALDGLMVLAPILTGPVREEIFAKIISLAQGDITLSSFDKLANDTTHPLSSFRMNFASGDLRRAAVIVVAALVGDAQRAEQAWDAARPLLRNGTPADSLAAAKAAYTLTKAGFPAPVPWSLLAVSPDPKLRQAAAALLGYSHPVDATAAEDLAHDTEPTVRREVAASLSVLASGSDTELAKRLAGLLADDVRYSVRSRVPEDLTSG